MIDLYLSSDGKHTVHVAAETAEQLAKLTPPARALYEAIIKSYGNKAQMWEAVMSAKADMAKVEQTMGEEAKSAPAAAPLCPTHHQPMVYRQGRFGNFWSCHVRQPDGSWCKKTKDAGQRKKARREASSN